MSIECKINDLLTDLERISITHPNIAEFWKKYILKKEEMLHNSLIECNSIIDKIHNLNEDVDPESLAIAYIFSKSLRNSYSSDI